MDTSNPKVAFMAVSVSLWNLLPVSLTQSREAAAVCKVQQELWLHIGLYDVGLILLQTCANLFC